MANLSVSSVYNTILYSPPSMESLKCFVYECVYLPPLTRTRRECLGANMDTENRGSSLWWLCVLLIGKAARCNCGSEKVAEFNDDIVVPVGYSLLRHTYPRMHRTRTPSILRFEWGAGYSLRQTILADVAGSATVLGLWGSRRLAVEGIWSCSECQR